MIQAIFPKDLFRMFDVAIPFILNAQLGLERRILLFSS